MEEITATSTPELATSSTMTPGQRSNEDKMLSPYNVDLAEETEKRESGMSLWQAVKADLRLIGYACGFSGTIIMEGYGLALITYFFSFESFNKQYGDEDNKLSYLTRVLLPLLAQLGSIVGICIASPLATALGYKRTTLLMLAISAAFILIPFFAKNVTALYAGFFLQGIPWGLFQVVSPAYASEVASFQLRPVLTTWNNACWVIGQLIAAGVALGFQSVDSVWAYKCPFALQWVFCVLLAVAVLIAPESPYWFLQKNRVNDARLATAKLVRKGDAYQTEARLALMQHTIYQEVQLNAELRMSEKDPSRTCGGSDGMFSLSCLKGVDRRRTEIACGTWLIQALCGSNLIPWAVRLFEKAGLGPSDAFSVNTGVPAGGLIGTLASWSLMRSYGRRTLYLGGCLAMAILLALAASLSFIPDHKAAGWGAGAVLIIYTVVYDLTVGPVCYCIVSEVPSIRLRAATIAMARGAYLIAGIFNHIITPKMLEDSTQEGWNIGPKTAFMYAGFCVLGLVYTWFRIPETGLPTRELDILFKEKVKANQFRRRALQLESQNL